MRTQLLLTSLLITLTSACLYPRNTDRYRKLPFTYDGETGPLCWHLLPNNTLCGAGKYQSPINITPNISGVTLIQEPLKLSFPNYSEEVMLEHTGHTILFTPKNVGNYTSVLGGKSYKLLQFHFHAPSEHRFADESYPLEVHFVHQDTEGKLAVVGVFFELGLDCGDKFLHESTHALDHVREMGDRYTINDINFRSIMNVTSESKVYTYAGSLTTPPCSEGVTWYVTQDSLSMSVTQFHAWKSVIKFNSRNTQNAPGMENLIMHSVAHKKRVVI
ncbi:alpha carbonic anhydrase [Terfezia claveryi]|nr:alpha carbonic anhydrase [Terfezia claveryi]